MALWRIVVKNSGNAACKDKRQRLEKGMFIETSTISPIPPIGVARERPMLAQLFLNKYGIEVNVHNMNSGYVRYYHYYRCGFLLARLPRHVITY